MTLGVLQGGKMLQSNDLVEKSRNQRQRDTGDGKYQHLPQDTTRTLIEQDLILDDLDYTSAPIAGDRILD